MGWEVLLIGEKADQHLPGRRDRWLFDNTGKLLTERADLFCATYPLTSAARFLIGVDPPAQDSDWKSHEEKQEKVQDGANSFGSAVPEEAIPDGIATVPSSHCSLRKTCIVRRSFSSRLRNQSLSPVGLVAPYH